MSINYHQFKREKVAECNICKKSAPLSWDHVPPKGGIELKEVEQVSIFQRLVIEPGEIKPRISQNGVKYRTLCKKCNERLGLSYDNVLNSFALGVGQVLKSKLELPDVIHYRTKPGILMRSILGHLLAAKSIIDKTVFDEKIRDFLLDKDTQLPEEIKIFYWIYPYRDIVVLRDIVMPATRGNFTRVGAFHGILKYFPIAYLVCNLEQYEGLEELTIYRHCKLNEIVEIPIRLTHVKHSLWPEMADEGNCIAFGLNINSSVHALPREL